MGADAMRIRSWGKVTHGAWHMARPRSTLQQERYGMGADATRTRAWEKVRIDTGGDAWGSTRG